METLDPHQAGDLARHVREALTRFGAAGQVSIEGDVVALSSPAGRFETPLGLVARDWVDLSPEERRRAATDLARRLNAQRLPSVPLTRTSTSIAPYALTILLLLALVAALAAYPFLARPTPPVASASVPSADPSGEDRPRLACEQSRARVLRGGTLGPLDVDGWVVQISLLRPGSTIPLMRDPGLDAFFDRTPEGSRLVWTGTPELAELDSPTTGVEVEELRYPAQGVAEWRELLVSFRGRFVDRYFREAERAQFFTLADGLTVRLGGTYSAVYARCAHRLDDAMVGTWIRGPDVPAVAAALVYYMDVRSAASHVDPQRLKSVPAESPGAILQIETTAEDLDRRGLAAILADTGGMIAGAPEGPITVMFPFRDFSRSSRASHKLARRLNLAR